MMPNSARIHKAKRIAQFRFVFLKRKCEQHRNSNRLTFIFYRLRYRNMQIRYNTDIPAALSIGKGFVIGHLGGTVINPNAVLGNNIEIMNGVLIGRERRGKRCGSPTIGNRVFIGSNAAIVGKINIGDDVLIAPNAYVNCDVPDHSIVIGNPCKIIAKENATADYINNIID